MRLSLVLFSVFVILLPELTVELLKNSNSFKNSLIRRKRSLVKLNLLKKPDPDFYRNVTELITSKGYPCEDHEVVTEDGFILSLQRIPAKSSLPNPPVAYLQHGLLDSSATWVINFPNQSLGFLLADAGCDVWMGNVRGNRYSKRHNKYTSQQNEFWDWSWDEMAKYDIPAMLKYISSKTGSQEINYVGHSQGTLVAFASISRNPEVAKLVKKLFAMAPIAWLGNVQGLLRALAYFAEVPEVLNGLLGYTEFLPSNPVIKSIVGLLCGTLITSTSCETLVIMGGLNKDNANASRIHVYLGHVPAGTSSKNVIHLAQLARTNNFQMFDYRFDDKNEAHYNQTTPPLYFPQNVKVPTYLFSGARDDQSTPKDVERLTQALPNVVLAQQLPNYEHWDFIWGLDTAKTVYKQIIEIIKG